MSEVSRKTRERASIIALVALCGTLTVAKVFKADHSHPEGQALPNIPENVLKHDTVVMGRMILDRFSQDNPGQHEFPADKNVPNGVKVKVVTGNGVHIFVLEADMKALNGQPDPNHTYHLDVKKLFPRSAVPVAEANITNPETQADGQEPKWSAVFERFSPIQPSVPAVVIKGPTVNEEAQKVVSEALIYPSLYPLDESDSDQGTPA
jgi:hypothetical protein